MPLTVEQQRRREEMRRQMGLFQELQDRIAEYHQTPEQAAQALVDDTGISTEDAAGLVERYYHHNAPEPPRPALGQEV